MDKYEYIVNLAEKTAKRVSQNRESWMKFLTSAARIYKYPFKEQLLIYAQNPDATACASIEIWNKRMNCWVNKGSSGIALPDDTATYGHKLKYVFDVSNVHAVKPNGRYPKAWKLREEHKSDVLHRLEQIYGSTDSTKPFEERIIEISDQLAADAYTELQIDYPDLQDRIGFDKLSEQDFALCLKKLISESVSFTILSACEIEISDHEFSFDYINQFVSIKTLSVLGTKINDSARGVLAEIGKTVRIYDKLREKEQEKEISKKELANAPQPRYNALKRESLQEGNSKDKDNIEGGKQNGPGIRTDGRLSDSETESKSGTGGNGNEIRTSEGQISEGEIRWGENSNVSGRNAESTSSRDSGTGKREDGSPDIPDGGERRSKRTAQSTGSDALGEEDEQHPEPGGGSRTERTDLQPTNFVKPEESYTQLSLFPSAEEQRGSITAAEASKKYTMPAAFYLPETDLEVIIRSGGGQKDSRKRIYAKYTEGKSTDEIIAFLKKEYSQVGKGFELHGHPISVWFDENGMTAGYGMQAAESVVTTLSWDQIEKYIHAMITYGLYMDANEAALVDKTEMERVSYQIGYFLRDWIDDVPEELNSIEKIETLLSTHEGREQLESFLEDVDARISYGELKPKTVKSPGYLLSEIADLDRERIHFPLHDTVDVRQEDFITQDEIDYALCIGSGFADGKFRIYEYFMDLHNQKENADFLKKEYGIGGQSGALPGNSSSNSEHDAKGILLEKGSLLNPYTKVLLNWNVVEERICELIYADKYFSPQEKEEYKNYKKEQEKKAKEAEITRLNNGIRLECKQEIEKQIAEKYNGFSVPQNTVSEIVEKYGIDCVQFVLANTIVQAWKEGRFSLRNKEWASSVLTEGEWSNTLILNTHPTILDGFTNQVRNLQHEKEQVVQEQLTLDGHLCILIDQWESGNVKYLIGNCVDDPDFYYVQCENRVFEFDHKPDKVEVEDYYIDILAEEDIDRHEAEVGAKLDGEELQRLSWQVVHEADDAFGNPTKWSARLFSDVFLWINKGNAVYSIYDAEGYPPLETFESLEDAMAWADELAADGRDIENSIPDETTPDTEEKQEESKAAPDKSAASNFQISDDHLGEGSPKEKFRRNLAAIVLLNRIESENRYATAEAQKSSDMFAKCQYMDELTGGKGITFATGTPISNSMTELYTNMRYLQYGTLKRLGMTQFDSWAASFGETQTAIELAPEGVGYRTKRRFSRFFNLPELISVFKEAADIKTADMLNLPVPEAQYENVVLKPSEYQKEMVASLANRAEAVRNQLVSPYQDNMLRITNDGRKLALDQRLINEMLPADENSKVAVCAEKSYHIWEETTSERSTQLIFCDLSTPRKNRDESFSVYDELKSLLMKKGVPEDEIAFIHDANTDQKKAELFAKVRSGQVRFLIGSTSKMGAGTNVQDRLIALHHLDVPWRPSDIEQQEGRILRQGNRNRKVKIFRYVTEGTFDAYSWQLIENKQKFISQIMTSKSPVRSCEDVDESALSYAEVKALATGNPYIKEKMDLDIQVSRLRLLKANYTSQKYRMEDNIVQHYPRQIVMVKELIEKLEQDIALYEQNAATSKDKFHMQVGSGVYDTRKDAGNAIIKFFQTDADGTAKIGTYLGFSMNIAFDSFNRKFVLRLKGAMNHPVEIGPDPVGNIIRLDNVLKTMPDKLAEAKDRLETLTNQLESAKIEVTKPFQQEEELAEKLKRLAELNALLNMDEKGTDALILEDDEQPAIVNSDMAVTPITSVKTKPMLKKKVVGLCL